MSTSPVAHAPRFRVRPARAEDSDAILEHSRLLAVQDGYISGHELTADDLTAEFTSVDRRFSCLVAESYSDSEGPGAILGHAVFFDLAYRVEKGPAIKLEELVVGSAWRGMGVGRALMRAIAVEAVERGADHVIWEVHRENEDGQRFYERVGGEPLPSWLQYWIHGEALERLASE